MNKLLFEIASKKLCWILFSTLVITGMSCAVIAPRTNESPIIDHPLADRSFITGEPCAPPCWYGLKLGESNEKKTRGVLDSLQFIDSSSIETRSVGYGDPITGEIITGVRIIGMCIEPEGYRCLQITLAGEKLKRIAINLNYDLSLGEIVNILGEPNFVSASMYGAEAAYCEVGLIWIPLQITATYTESNSEKAFQVCSDIANGIKMDRSISVDIIEYVEPRWFEIIPRIEIDHPWPVFED